MGSSANLRVMAVSPCMRRRVMGPAGSEGVHLMVNFEPAWRTSCIAGAVRTSKPTVSARTLVAVASAKRQAFANENCILKN